MLYFIPAWYQLNNWCENEQSWHIRRMRSEFDDTVKQVQMFHRSRVTPYRILLLSFAPNFRHFLHRLSVFRAPYWSCFDAIAEIQRTKPVPLSFHNLEWPDGIELVYTPFVIVGMLNGKKYAQADFGEDGNLIRVDLYENDVMTRRNIYDDRGFLSSTIRYEGSRSIYQDYLMENGIRKMRVFFRDGHVEINPKAPEYRIVRSGSEYLRAFRQFRYDSLEDVIREVFAAYVDLTEPEDLFCAAAHERHARLLAETMPGHKLLLSFYGARYLPQNYPEGQALVDEAEYLITDSAATTDMVQEGLREPLDNITDITPYDTRHASGVSQQLTIQRILFPVDKLGEEEFADAIRLMAEHLEKNDRAVVSLFTRRAQADEKQWLLEKTRSCLEQAGYDPHWASADTPQQEANTPDGEWSRVRFVVEQCVSELAVSRCMQVHRVLVDLRRVPELYLQILALSYGLPQIVRRETQYVENGANGIVLEQPGQLPEALDFYLDGLKNWNEANVAAYELGKSFTTDVLLKKWKEVIDTVG